MSPVQLFLSFAAVCTAAILLMLHQAETKAASGKTNDDSGGFSLGGLLGGGLLGGGGSDGAQHGFTDASQTRRTEFYGWTIDSPGVMDATDRLFLLSDIVDGYPKWRQRPEATVQIPAQSSCDIRPLAGGEVLANIQIGRATIASDLHVYSNAVMAQDTTYWIGQTLLKSDFISDDDIVRDHPMPMADVIVTDTSAPVYLLLQHRLGNVLWNIHTAPGVEIAHIAMLGQGARALSAPAGDHSVQALAPAEGCAPAPARKPADHWEMISRGLADDPEQHRARTDAGYAAYDAWFRATFDQGSEDAVIGAASVNHLLVGPAPHSPAADSPVADSSAPDSPAPDSADTRVAYRPLKSAKVLVTGADHIIALPKKQRVAQMQQVQRALAAKAAGGDLAMLFPEPMRRGQP
jgi:hypothetical protein